jgi:very-short-patch-repair endonuclease
VTSPPRTLLDLAEVVSPRDLERALAEAQGRGLARHNELLEQIERNPGRRGIARLRDLLQRQEGPALTRSEAEERLLALLRAARLPSPELNARVGGHEVDFLWRDASLIVEVDGYAFHSSRLAFERDRLRDAELQAAGFQVARATWRQIVDEPHALIARIAHALALARAA